ncbi:MAG: hypothetical protein AAGG69_11220 [Pseudomonadota bacterium]
MRRSLPIAGVSIVVVLISAVVFVRPGAVASVADIELSAISIEGGSLVMDNPRLDGVSGKNLPYSVRATRAIQAGPTAQRVQLENLSAEFAMEEDLTGTLESPFGVFERDSERLELSGGSVFRRSDGLSAYFETVEIGINDGSLETEEMVRVEQPGQELTAGSAKFLDSGKKLIFEGDVRIVLKPAAINSVLDEGQR